jgi:4-hydroxy-2-oxoheptanedioate aldolase
MATSESVVLRERLCAGATTIGAILPLDAPLLVELCGIAGFDFVFLDTEHGAILHPSYENLTRAADRWNLPSVVRVARDQPIDIGRALDAGAQGVHLPFVETAAQAEAAANAARFFPLGQRGLGPVRAARYGFEPFDAYVKRANDETLVVAAIETPQAVEQIEAIGQVEGVDVIFIAPADLSVMLGHPGQFDHPEVTMVVERAIAAARATGKWVGSLAASPEHARALAAAGVQYILMVFTGMLVRSLESWLATARA